jgi:hypothetical protein
MARPKSSEAAILSSRLILRLTKRELTSLQDYARLCGKSVSDVVRDKIVKGRFPSPKQPKIDLQTYMELKKIGVNLNQVARVLNSGRSPGNMEFYKMVMKLDSQLNLIVAKLIYDSGSADR